MANISFATGTLIIHADSDAIANRICDIIFDDIASNWEYGTFIDCRHSDDDREYENSCEANFTGYGRWTYLNNVESLANWIDSEFKTNPQLNKKDRAFLEAQKFVIEFFFNDEEEGNLYCAYCKATFTHKANTPLLNSEAETDWEEILDYESHATYKDDEEYSEEDSAVAVSS